MFEKWMIEFNLSRKKIFYRTHFRDLLIKWKFEYLPTILIKPTFISYLENSANFRFSSLMVESINQAIDYLKYWFYESEQTVERYLLESDQESIIQRYYLDFLLQSHVLVEKFIEKALIPWIFEVAFNLDHQEGNERYNPEIYFQFQKENLIFEFQKAVQKILKLLIQQQKNDGIFVFLERAYQEKNAEKQETIAFLKRQAKK